MAFKGELPERSPMSSIELHDWLPATPFRSHVNALIAATGLPWRAVALQAGVPPRVVRTLILGRGGRLNRKIPRSAAISLLALSETALKQLRRRYVPCDAARRLVGRLRAAGLDDHDIATLLRLDDWSLTSIDTGTRLVDEYTLLLARAACDARCPDESEPAYREWFDDEAPLGHVSTAA